MIFDVTRHVVHYGRTKMIIGHVDLGDCPSWMVASIVDRQRTGRAEDRQSRGQAEQRTGRAEDRQSRGQAEQRTGRAEDRQSREIPRPGH
jgi:hypothetical protein